MSEIDVKVLVKEVHSIPVSSVVRIVAMELGVTSRAYLENGAFIEFDHCNMELIREYPASPAIRITSRNASNRYNELDRSGLWTAVFKGAKFVNFHGIWNLQLLKSFVAKMPNLGILSLTYGCCDRLAEVIDAIECTDFFELHLHVPVGQKWSVVNAIQKMESRGITLQNLLLVFSGRFVYSDFHELMPDVEDTESAHPHTLAPSVLADNAEVLILHGGELKRDGWHCIQELEEHGYKLDGNVEMAQNLHSCKDDDHEKVYEKYKVYAKLVGNRRIRQGSLLGEAREIPQSSDPVPVAKGDPRISMGFLPNYQACRHQRPKEIYLHRQELLSKENLSRYDVLVNRKCDGEGVCCLFNADCDEESLRHWRIPGFETTRIQKVVYHEKFTEYLTSNGFFVRVPAMDREADFYAAIICSRRIVFECTDCLRLRVETGNMQLFLRNAIHVEFVGDWANNPLREIPPNFNPIAFRKLTVLRVIIRRQPIRWLVQNRLTDSCKNSLTHFHFDARDTFDISLGSAFNGVYQSLREMDEIVVIGSTWTSERFNFRFNVLKTDMAHMLSPGGTCTVVCMEQAKSEDLWEYGFRGYPFAVLIQTPYSRQKPIQLHATVPYQDPPPHIPADQHMLMMGFYTFHANRHYNIVVPWNHSIAMSIPESDRPHFYSCKEYNY